jgi:hypothetical protein
MYRGQEGVKSLLLDDDNCDCLSTLSMGHGLCGTGFSTQYGPVRRWDASLKSLVQLLIQIGLFIRTVSTTHSFFPP